MTIARRQRLWLLVLIFSISAIACERPGNTAGSTQPPTPLTVAYSSSPGSIPLFIAFENRRFEDRSLQVDGKEFSNGRLCLDALLSGQVDLATVADTPLAYAALHNIKFSIIARISTSGSHVRCIARRDRGITEPGGLAGHKIAYAAGTTIEYYMDMFLKEAGLTREKVMPVNIQPQAMAAALASGEVDAIFDWEPYIHLSTKLLGDRAVILSGVPTYRMNFCVVALPKTIEQKSRLIEAFLQAVVDATGDIRRGPLDAVVVKAASRMKVESDVLKAIWSTYQFDVRLDPGLINELNAEAEWVKRDDPTLSNKPIPDFRKSFINDGPLRQIRPSAIDLPPKNTNP